MPNVHTTLTSLFTAIANAIRAKTGGTAPIVADDFPDEIAEITTEPTLQSKTVSPSASQQVVEADSGYDGLDRVTVNAMRLQSKTTKSDEWQNITVEPDTGYDGLSFVVVERLNLAESSANPMSTSRTYYPTGLDGFKSFRVNAVPVEQETITQNGTYTPTSGKWFDSVTVNVVPTLITKNISQNGTYDASTFSADGFSSVVVNVSGGGTLITKTVTANGTYNASADNADGYSQFTVAIPTYDGTVI